jgi:hypothetical protein
MGKCTICSHGEREEIDRALVRGEGLRGLAFAISVAGREVGRNMESPWSVSLTPAMPTPAALRLA